MYIRPITRTFLITCLLAALTACGGGAKVTSPAPTIVIPTQAGGPSLPTAAMPAALATALPTFASAAPTASLSLSASSLAPTSAGPTRISMAAGKTVASVDGALSAGGSAVYLANAQANQYLMANLSSTNQDLVLKITAPDGSLLLSSADKHQTWQGALPQSGDYSLTVIANGAGASYGLSVVIPARVTFKAGAISASLSGYVGASEVTTYLLRAMQGQTLSVSIAAPQKDVFLTIYGLDDGQPYVRSVTGSTSASFSLPSSQDYVIEAVSTGKAAENYTITFTAK
jgi:hypothetical protein